MGPPGSIRRSFHFIDDFHLPLALPAYRQARLGECAQMYRRLILVLAIAISACAPPAAPARMQPDAIGQHVVALLDAGRIEDAQLWYFRGAFRAFVWDGLYDDDFSEAFSHRIAYSPRRERIREIDPDTAVKFLEDAIAWDAATPPDFPAAPAPEKLAALPELRKQVAAWMMEGLAEEKAQLAAARQAETEIAAGGPTAEGRSMILAAESLHAIATGSIKLSCKDEHIYFPGRFHGSAPANTAAKVVIAEACNDVLFLDGETGRVLQRAPWPDFQHASVLPDGDMLRLVALSPRVGANPNGAVQQMTATAAPSAFDMPLPKDLAGHAFTVPRSTGSADGRIAAAEFCIEARCNLFAAFDLKERRIIWQGAHPTGRSRLMWHIDKVDGRYVLVSEMRAADGFSLPYTGELIDLSTGAVRETSYDELPGLRGEPGHPYCHLTQLGSPAGPEFRYRVYWPDRSRFFDLVEPARGSITDCAVSADGGTLLVAVPPFIHRFALKP
jgi:hypothetical protein